jgi:hypothetical protein
MIAEQEFGRETGTSCRKDAVKRIEIESLEAEQGKTSSKKDSVALFPRKDDGRFAIFAGT